MAYLPRRSAVSLQVPVRGLSYHLSQWGEPAAVTPARPAVVLLHGWMDVGASFQFMVDALAGERCLYAPDWRGFGRTQAPATDSYWFPDYLGDLDALLDALSPHQPVDLVAHSMGANVALLYAGARPARVRRLVSLEGFGMPETAVSRTPQRYARWLDELKTPQTLTTYATLAEVAERLRRNNPRLTAERAAWLAPHWAALNPADGRYHVQGDPAHKRVNAVRYRADEAGACVAAITAPVLWIEGRQTEVLRLWGTPDSRAKIEAHAALLRQVERLWFDDCGHMVQHDQPEALAAHVERFLDAG